jgi:hypothetical protein
LASGAGSERICRLTWIARAVEAIEVFVAEDVVAAMNRYNRKDDKTPEDN